MSLIKKKDAKSYFAARRSGKPFRVQAASEPYATGSSDAVNLSTNASLASVAEVPESKSPVVTPVPPITGERKSGIALVPSAKKSVRT